MGVRNGRDRADAGPTSTVQDRPKRHGEPARHSGVRWRAGRARRTADAGDRPGPVRRRLDAEGGALVRVALRYYLAPRALLDQLRHLRQIPLRQRYYAASRDGMGYLVVRPTTVEMLDA